MKIDKEKLQAIISLPDEELWKLIREVASGRGFTLPEKAPPHSELEKIRNAVNHGANPNIAEALRVINDYRRGKRNG